MATNNNDKTLNVPPLRFPEFTGEWENYKFQDICNLLSGGTPALDNPSYWNGNIPFISAATMHNSYIVDSEQYLSEEGLAHGSKLLQQGNLLLLVRGSMLWKHIPICYNKLDVAFNQDVKGIIPNKFSQPLFLLYWFESHESRMKYMVTGTGIGAGKLDTGTLLSMNVSLPSQTEQERIISLLQLLDERIATQNKIIEDLKKLRAAIVDKLFCLPNKLVPQMRLHGFTGNWIQVRLSDVCQRIHTKNFNTQCQLVLTIAAQYGLVSQKDFFKKSIASDNLEGYYLIEKDDFAYNKSYSTDYPWGAVKRLELYSQGVLSPLYICFRPNTNIIVPDYLSHYFESTKWHKGIADIAGEGARNHGLLNLSVVDYFNTTHRIPSMPEQKVIADVLNKLTFKYDLEQKLHENLLKQRRYLLQQMFI